MKQTKFFLVAAAFLLILSACNKGETYADQKDRERNAVYNFILARGINVISEQQFIDQGYTTDVSHNQYVLFPTTGVYLQIVSKGCGKKIDKGESATVLCRFTEYNILGDSVQLSNNALDWSAIADKMSVSNTSGTFTASFDAGSSLMYRRYKNTSVPSGWLVPFSYINVGRPEKETDELAKVNIIVPHTQGHYYASTGVYPCQYEITYERGLEVNA